MGSRPHPRRKDATSRLFRVALRRRLEAILARHRPLGFKRCGARTRIFAPPLSPTFGFALWPVDARRRLANQWREGTPETSAGRNARAATCRKKR